MKYYFKNFIKKMFANKNDAYLFILWCVYKNISQPQKLSDLIKIELTDLVYDEFKFTKKREIAARIVQKLKNIEVSSTRSNFSKMTSIQIKNFKAFGAINEEDQGIYIELDQKKNIFFAPNGGGKTSLCEALEYKLTKTIKEAVRRGIPLKEYIRRNEEKEEIQIKFFDNTINLEKLSDFQIEYYHKCFIEKNRLQEFALLGSKDTGTKERDVIAVILGLQDLDDLISSFVQPASFKLDQQIKPV
ncbi:MAG: AAA family ATPase [Paenibacillaceae bacterium]